jgi:o-succinylbenzoate synthase
MKAFYISHPLIFKNPAGTSRGILTEKPCWILVIKYGNGLGIGECSLIPRLSYDDHTDFENKIKWLCEHIHRPEDYLKDELKEYPGILFGLETALKSFNNTDPYQIFPSAFSNGEATIPINGLIWMGEKDFMIRQLEQRLEEGFTCLKMKIGAINFDEELQILRHIRKHFSAAEIELRVDANGAFSADEALEKLNTLSDLQLHSIEQPIKTGIWEDMARLCAETPLPIALDEELIPIRDTQEKYKMLYAIKPQFIILKPGLIGGFSSSDEWIDIAKKMDIGYWITSALESNIGLNAIAQYCFTKDVTMPQGLGTGSLYTNNFESPLVVTDGILKYDNQLKWLFFPDKMSSSMG